MKYFIAMLTVLFLSFSGCSNDGAKAEELFETAQFEELQNNPEHARKLYADILKKYPDTKFAEKAKVKLATLRN